MTNGLNRLIKKSENIGLIGAVLESSPTTFTNLQYKDDILFFGNCNIRRAIVLKWTIYYFEAWATLTINFHNSSMVLLGKQNFAFPLCLAIWDVERPPSQLDIWTSALSLVDCPDINKTPS